MTDLTKRQRHLRKHYTRARHRRVYLRIGNQSFTIAIVEEDDSVLTVRQLQSWYRDMLAKALDNLLTREGVKQ